MSHFVNVRLNRTRFLNVKPHRHLGCRNNHCNHRNRQFAQSRNDPQSEIQIPWFESQYIRNPGRSRTHTANEVLVTGATPQVFRPSSGFGLCNSKRAANEPRNTSCDPQIKA